MSEHAVTVRRMGLTGFSNLLIGIAGIILLAILTKTLSVADYGTWSLILVTIVLIPTLVTLGLPAATIRFLAAAKETREVQEIFYSMGLVVLLSSSIVAALFAGLAPQIAAALFDNNYYASLLLAPIVFTACLNFFLLQYFRTFQQIKRYAIITLLQAYLNVAFITVFILGGYGLLGALSALLLQQLVVLLMMLSLIFAEIGVAIPKFTYVREHIRYGLPLVPGNLSSWVVNSSDRYLIGLLLGTMAVGYYSPGYSVGSIIMNISAPFMIMLPAVLSKHYDEERMQDVRMILRYSLKYYLGLAIPSVFALSVLSRPLLLVLTTPEIAANGYLVTPFIAAASMLLGAYEVIVMSNILKKKTAVIGTIWIIGAASNFGLNLLLIPFVGLVGAAVATLLAYLLAFMLTTIYSFRQLSFGTDARFIIKSVIAATIMAVFLLVWNPAGLASLVVAGAFAAGVYLIAILVLRGFTLGELKLVYRMFIGS